jgi:4-hydroxybenzoate polyprenyltransferase
MSSQSTHFTDISTRHWLYRIFPVIAHPYLSLMRLDRPIGTWLLLLPAWWIMALELDFSNMKSMIDWLHALWLFFLFGMGAIIMRGAGCVINDLWDRDIDKQVERTRSRPLASGAITPQRALFFLMGLLLVSLVILIQLPSLAIILGFLSLIPVIIYPLAKRWTWYPQAVLGLTFNFGVLMGSASIDNNIGLSAIILYLASIAWTLGYDTIYAHQDMQDDSLVGVKSTALKFGNNSTAYITAFYALFVFGLLMILILNQAGFIAYALWVLALVHFIWQIKSLDYENPSNCLSKFKSNRDVGFIILLMMICV